MGDQKRRVKRSHADTRETPEKTEVRPATKESKGGGKTYESVFYLPVGIVL
jgi:hypothetical protein